MRTENKAEDKRIKLFFIINTFSAGGGAEALLAMVVNALYDTGRYDIGIMEIIHHGIKCEEVNPHIKIYPYYTLASAPDRKERMYYVYREWDKVINEYIPDDYDIYISFNYLKPTFLLPKGKKCISWIHGDIYNLINKYPGLRVMTDEKDLQKVAFSKTQLIVAISDNTRQSIIDIYPEFKTKIRTIYTGIDTNRVKRLSEMECNIKLISPSLIYIGRLEKGKDPFRTLDIFTKLHELKPDVHLYYLGYGDLSEKVNNEVNNRGLGNHVHLLGYYDNPFPIIKQASVTIMTSKSEGFPMSLLESVALNVPFVSTVVGGSKELSMHHGCGITFSDNMEAVRGIVHFLGKDKQEIIESTNNAIKEFSMDTYISNIENVFDELLNL